MNVKYKQANFLKILMVLTVLFLSSCAHAPEKNVSCEYPIPVFNQEELYVNGECVSGCGTEPVICYMSNPAEHMEVARTSLVGFYSSLDKILDPDLKNFIETIEAEEGYPWGSVLYLDRVIDTELKEGLMETWELENSPVLKYAEDTCSGRDIQPFYALLNGYRHYLRNMTVGKEQDYGLICNPEY